MLVQRAVSEEDCTRCLALEVFERGFEVVEDFLHKNGSWHRFLCSNTSDLPYFFLLLPPTQRVPVWTRRWGEILQPSDEYALRAVRPYTAPSHT